MDTLNPELLENEREMLRQEDSGKPSIWLILEDQRLSESYQAYLELDGYQVLSAVDGGSPPGSDLIITDAPDCALDKVRRRQGGRISGTVFLLHLSEEGDARQTHRDVAERGYFSLKRGMRPRKLSAQVRGLLHRTGQLVPEGRRFRVGDILLDRSRHWVMAAGRTIDLTPTEFDLLSIMMAAPGQTFTRMELLTRLGGNSDEGSERTIDVHIRNIRAKLAEVLPPDQVIKTVHRVGYGLYPDQVGS